MGTHLLKLHFCWFLDHPSSRQPDPACCRPRYSSKCSGTASGVATRETLRLISGFNIFRLYIIYGTGR